MLHSQDSFNLYNLSGPLCALSTWHSGPCSTPILMFLWAQPSSFLDPCPIPFSSTPHAHKVSPRCGRVPIAEGFAICKLPIHRDIRCPLSILRPSPASSSCGGCFCAVCLVSILSVRPSSHAYGAACSLLLISAVCVSSVPGQVMGQHVV